MAVGFLKLYRSMLDWEWYKDANTCRLWIHILLKANFKRGRFEGIVIPEGSFVTSYGQLSAETGLSQRSVRTALNHLKSTGEVTIKTTNKFTLITVEKWANFQVDELRYDKLVDTVSDNQVTSNRQATDKQVTTIEERKKERKKEGKNYSYSINTSSNEEEQSVSKIVSKFWEDHKNEEWMNRDEKQNSNDI